MTDSDLIKSIRGVVKEEIDSALKPVKKTLDEHSNILYGHTKKLDGITNQLTEVSEDVAEIKNKAESQDKRIATIEDRIGLLTFK